MPSFDALEEITYDFTRYVADDPNAKGVVPEPSSEQIETFMAVLREIMPVKEGEDGKVSLDLAELSARYQDSDGHEVDVIVDGAVAALCSNQPSVAVLARLPFRVKRAFYGWIMGVLLSPEA